jgi:hypothetical protein
MAIGESQPLARQAIDIRRGDLAPLGVVTPHVTIPEVIGQDHDDVGLANRIALVTRIALASRLDRNGPAHKAHGRQRHHQRSQHRKWLPKTERTRVTETHQIKPVSFACNK